MIIAWIDLSTHWSLSSVQAALNVIISVLGTVGIWSFSRYWWQQSSSSVLRGDPNVPLSALLTISGPAEGWDVIKVLRKQVLARQNWHLLLQIFVTIFVTLSCMLSGPIAKISLREGKIVQSSGLDVLQAVKGDGPTANYASGMVLWNETIKSLDQAGFPYDQILDYLPPSTANWTYVAHEWNPSWILTCNYTSETVLHNVAGVGNYNLYDPIDVFPAYRETYDPSWLNTSEYRIQADFTGWQVPTDDPPFKDFLFFILIESDPEVDDRMDTNKELMQLSISVLHLQGFQALDFTDVGEAGATTWQPVGPVGNASYSRVECTITPKPNILNADAIPWVWTNDTYSITKAYQDYWTTPVEDVDTKDLIVATPTPEDLVRFFQAYMVSVNTEYALPSLRTVSVWVDAVQLSIIFLAIIIMLTTLTLWLTGRYLWFLRRQKSNLEEVRVPDGKMEWMIHAARTAHDAEQLCEVKRTKDRDHFSTASFGYVNTQQENTDAEPRRPSLARVYASRHSVSGLPPCKLSASTKSTPQVSQQHPPSIFAHAGEDNLHHDQETGRNLKQTLISQDSQGELESSVSSAGDGSQPFVPESKKLSLQVSGKPSIDRSQPTFNAEKQTFKSNSQTNVLEMEEVDPRDDTASKLS